MPHHLNDFSLIETLLWEKSDFFLLKAHLERLEKSARHFSFQFDRDTIENVLENTARSFDPSGQYRLRLLLQKNGEFKITSSLLETQHTTPVKVAISDERTDKTDIFLAHKTTNRELYDRELKKYRAEGFFDIIFLNRDNEVTEGAITNVIVRKDNSYWTPPLSCGVLPGIYRQHLLQNGELSLKEKVLYKEDLTKADELFVVNSVRKMIPAFLEE